MLRRSQDDCPEGGESSRVSSTIGCRLPYLHVRTTKAMTLVHKLGLFLRWAGWQEFEPTRVNFDHPPSDSSLPVTETSIRTVATDKFRIPTTFSLTVLQAVHRVRPHKAATARCDVGRYR